MKAAKYDKVRTLVEVKGNSSGKILPVGTKGVVVECHQYPKEGYTVDLSIPNKDLVGCFDYDKVVLRPDQFEVIHAASEG
jgi:hypothetical protein